ncbi:YceI family protein [Mycobacterium sp. BMJ-28]
MKRARWRILVGLLILLLLAVVAVAPWAFRTYVEGAPEPALAVAPDGAPATTGINGSWAVRPGSQAGYRAEQQLLWQTVDVNGRTSQVTGTAEVAESRLVSAEFTVNVASIQSSHHGRDERFRGADVMDAAKYPTAKVTVSAPLDLTSVPDNGQPLDVEVPINLTLHGVSRPASAHATIARNGDRVDVAGAIPVRFYDYNVSPPKPFASLLEVQPIATIEFLVHLTKG